MCCGSLGGGDGDLEYVEGAAGIGGEWNTFWAICGEGCWTLMGGAWSWKLETGRVGERGEAYWVVVVSSPFSAHEYGSIAWVA